VTSTWAAAAIENASGCGGRDASGENGCGCGEESDDAVEENGRRASASGPESCGAPARTGQ